MHPMPKSLLALFLAAWIFSAPLAASNVAYANRFLTDRIQSDAYCREHACDNNSTSSIVGISFISIILALLGFGIYKDYVKKTAAREAGLDKTADKAPTQEELDAAAREAAANAHRWTRAELEQEALKQFLEEESAGLKAPQAGQTAPLQSGMALPAAQ